VKTSTVLSFLHEESVRSLGEVKNAQRVGFRVNVPTLELHLNSSQTSQTLYTHTYTTAVAFLKHSLSLLSLPLACLMTSTELHHTHNLLFLLRAVRIDYSLFSFISHEFRRFVL